MSASSSIYQVSLWNSGTTYTKWEIVRHPNILGNFFYSLTPSNVNNNPSTDTTNWGGTKTFNGQTYSHFFFKINYPINIPNEPKQNTIRFGDGYEQRVQKNINNNLLMLDFTLEKRTNAEAKAIAHFLHARKGTQAFIFQPPAPYNIDKLFVCKRWGFSYEFLNNNGIRVEFEEVPA